MRRGVAACATSISDGTGVMIFSSFFPGKLIVLVVVIPPSPLRIVVVRASDDDDVFKLPLLVAASRLLHPKDFELEKNFLNVACCARM
jgi:hypothetical protein